MKLDLYRLFDTDRSITGRIAVDGQQFCFDLEPARLKPVHEGHPAIPCGVYKVKLTPSPHFGYVTPEILDVPGRISIRWHKGNKPEDSLGCTLIGGSIGVQPDWIADSADAFDRLMKVCAAAESRGEEITVEYHDLASRQATF